MVDDDKAVRDLIVACLSRAGYTVTEAAHGLDAILDARDIDLVITDVLMPKMSGLELAAYLRQHNPLTRVLVISGYMDYSLDQIPGFRGTVAFLAKPFPAPVLLAKVRELIEENRPAE